MASPPVGSVVGLGSTVIDRGYPFFVSEDTSGNIVTPSGHYGWNPTSNLWVPMQVDSNGVVQTALTGSNAIGYQDVTGITTTVAGKLTVPPGATQCLIYVDGGNIRARWDGQAAPTSTDGMFYPQGTNFALYTLSDMENFETFEDSASGSEPILRVTYS